jgi:ABC-type nitrate/sulfonate/bicarbonate transport system permease component
VAEVRVPEASAAAAVVADEPAGPGDSSAVSSAADSGAGAPRARRAAPNWPGLLFALAVIGLWQVAVSSGMLQLRFLPAPSTIAMDAWGLLVEGRLIPDFLHTLWSAIQGWVLGGLMGVCIGVWLGFSAWSWRLGMSTVDFLRAIPAICFVPVAALLLGFSLQMELLVTTYAALWPTLVNTIEGVRKTSSMHRETGRMLHLSRTRQALSISLPSAAGSILVGLRLSLALSLMLAVVAEMVGNPAGMGYSLVMTQQALETGQMFAYIIVIGLTGLLLNAGFNAVVKRVFPGIVANLKEDV